MTRRLSIILTCAFVLMLAGCSTPAVSPSPGARAESASSLATRTVVGDWIPTPRGAPIELVSLTLGSDGQVSQELTSTQPAVRFSERFGGTWRSAVRGLLVFEREGVTANYRYSSTDDRLTLTWASGTVLPSGASAGPIHFATTEGDSWITGTRGALELTRRR